MTTHVCGLCGRECCDGDSTEMVLSGRVMTICDVCRERGDEPEDRE